MPSEVSSTSPGGGVGGQLRLRTLIFCCVILFSGQVFERGRNDTNLGNESISSSANEVAALCTLLILPERGCIGSFAIWLIPLESIDPGKVCVTSLDNPIWQSISLKCFGNDVEIGIFGNDAACISEIKCLL